MGRMGRMGRIRRATLLFLAAVFGRPQAPKTDRHVCQNPTFNVAKLHVLDMFCVFFPAFLMSFGPQ
jgi:hypothetical protein